MSALIVALTVVALTAVYLMVLIITEGFTGGLQFIPLAAFITIATTALTTITYLFSPLLWVLVWIAALAAATPLAILKLARTYPRQRIEKLLTERIATVLGKDWNKRISITFAKDNTATKVIVIIGAAMIPSDVTPRLKAVIAETLSGQWKTSTQGTRVTVNRIVVRPDPPRLRDLKAILCGPKAFTSTAKVFDHHITEDGEVHGFAVKYDEAVASGIALGYRKRDIQRLISERIDPGEGNSLSFDWDTKLRVCTVKRSVFKSRIDNPLAVPVAYSIEDALRIYHDLEIPVGEDELGNQVKWSPRKLPHVLLVGQTGTGKSSTGSVLLEDTTLAGFCIIVADFKGDTEYNGWRDWPNVHLVAQDFYSCLRAIAYAHEIMDRRRSGVAALAGAPPDNVPLLLLVDEFTVCTKNLDPLWRQFRNADKSLPPSPPTIEAVGSIKREGRSLRVHEVDALQRATADNIPREFVFNSPFTIQCGRSDSVTSFNLWDDSDVGQQVPVGVPGRALTRGPNGFVQFQGYYVPDPAKATSERDLAALAAMRPPVSLYPRMVIDMPDADKIERWDQIATAPIVPAESRPDLDPLSPEFKPRRVFRVDTTSKTIDAASMQLITSAAPAPAPPPATPAPDEDLTSAQPTDEQSPQAPDDNEPHDDSTDETAPEPAPTAKRRRATRQEVTPIRSIQGEALSKTDYRR